ncbi:hypothetical protein BOO36_13050 [Vibrio navarrensis]|uniref:hypothetical protein n=1 Tax=Vibrio navarrensis TaxID=29495 RepID=UPI00186A5609|nr:hypothetical protein [Vibrio navarrensis]MBE4574747.1 hypothetical protein [Vibrio navarrensis]
MAKRFCKMNRKEIADQLGEIHQLVAAPKYLCRACVRSSAAKGSLCKPQAIPSLKALRQKAAQSEHIVSQPAPIVVKPSLPVESAEANLVSAPLNGFALSLLSLNKKQLKKAKKALKKQRKYHKKLAKLAKQKAKQLKRREKLERKLHKFSGVLRVLNHTQAVRQETPMH